MKQINTLSQNKLKFLKKLHLKKYRDQFGLCLCEGFRLFQTAITTKNLQIQEIILDQTKVKTDKKKYILKQSLEKNIDILYCDQSQIRKLSSDVTPTGILFTVKLPMPEDLSFTQCNADILIYIDKVTNPGNLGTILRSAVWFGNTIIFLSSGSVDPYNAKVISASAGAIFGCAIYKDIDFQTMYRHFKQKNYSIIATTPNGNTFLHEWKPKKKVIICFGQEASGLSLDIINKADTLLTIKKYGAIESLNLSVTAGIILNHVAEIHE
jgi:TrmH family RNA methyltransferase